MTKRFKITNHNRYENECLAHDGYYIKGHDEYSMLYQNCPEFFPDRNLMGHKIQVIQQLKEDICPDIDKFIRITPAEQRTYGFSFSLLVFNAERSALIKLTYS